MIAIVIPYYKLTYFDDTLQSLANQTDQRFKVYIGNDASPEDPTDVLERYNGKFNFHYHYFKNNLGNKSLTQHWERCIELSDKEEWLMILGDDDVLGQNVVEQFYYFILQKKQVDLIRFNLRVIDQDGCLMNDRHTDNDKNHETIHDLLDRMLNGRETITASEFVFSRNIYIKSKGFVDFPLAWFSDYATWLAFSKEKGIEYLKKATVYWRLSDINISSKSDSIAQIELKVRSLFMFLSFLHSNFNVNLKNHKKFLFIHLNSLLANVSLFRSTLILVKQTFYIKSNGIRVLEFILMNTKRFFFKAYAYFRTPQKR